MYKSWTNTRHYKIKKGVIILQINRLSMKSITLNYSFWVEVRQIFLNLFIGSKRVIVCSESSIVRSGVYFLVLDRPILFQWSVAALFQYNFVETFTAKFKFIRGRHSSIMSYYIDRLPLYI